MAEKLVVALRGRIGGQVCRLLRTGNPIIHSHAILPSRWVKRINQSDADLVHLHWVGGEMLSIADVALIKKPIVWTLHDMWAFCGAEHYTDDLRWRDGYRRDNRPPHESGFDLNRWTWQRKRKHWQRPISIVTPSRWLTSCVSESVLMQDWPVTTIPNPIDVDQWAPVDKSRARDLLNLPKGVPLLLFGAIRGEQNSRKGFDLLARALEKLRDYSRDQGLELVVFGQCPPRSPPAIGLPIHYSGRIHDVLSLRVLYSAADAMVIPSRQDNLPNTGVEAQACGTPLVAFEIGGLPDIVSHQSSGYLAKPYDAADLAKGIAWVLSQREKTRFREEARRQAVGRYSYPVVAEQYLKVYNDLLLG